MGAIGQQIIIILSKSRGALFPTEYVREVIASENQERHWPYQDARESPWLEQTWDMRRDKGVKIKRMESDVPHKQRQQKKKNAAG